ncbi:hypothetical protein Nepgr_002164 [Nepenthes gracilis]|uniref:Inhibitor I9 domain-containing protein n=1 Tax=Nepenthes gracilis TaxID=150966 RepID=A0AAD3P7F9_NEPGR|nr:hypothetical protein Nepgr_002164 [Nepenthes gracilis]
MEARIAASLLLLCALTAASTAMAEGLYGKEGMAVRSASPLHPPRPTVAVYVVFTEKLGLRVYLHILSSVLGSEEAAEKALVYHYKIMNAFAARLTPKQAALMAGQPGVIYVMPPATIHLDNPPATVEAEG